MKLCIQQHMPDVISNVQTMNLNRADTFMEDAHGSSNGEDPLLSHLTNLNHQTINLLNLDHLGNDPMLSASSTILHQLQQQRSTVDMSVIDPIITNYGLMSMHHQSNCDNPSVESILQSDTDSLISDIDMMTWHNRKESGRQVTVSILLDRSKDFCFLFHVCYKF